jgi:N-acylneuraminate cytidylyltransferase
MGCRLGGKVGIYQMDDSSSVEIDEPEDWELAEKKLAQKITLDIAVEH